MKRLSFLLLCLTSAMPTLAHGRVGKQPFTVVIEAEQTEVKAGSDVWLRVSLTNNSDRDLDMSGGLNLSIGLDPNYRFEVRDDRGSVVPKRIYPHPELAPGRPINRTVKPQETFTEEQRVSALYDMRKPGKYIVRVSRRASENPRDGEFKSNDVSITVVP